MKDTKMGATSRTGDMKTFEQIEMEMFIKAIEDKYTFIPTLNEFLEGVEE